MTAEAVVEQSPDPDPGNAPEGADAGQAALGRPP